ncbi:MAG TPA: hypothetical protein VMF69_15875, partial [Gemmataceae bacterium]|nr:hypothetical protein [Gemmataceae bacterium]
LAAVGQVGEPPAYRGLGNHPARFHVNDGHGSGATIGHKQTAAFFGADQGHWLPKFSVFGTN